MKKTNKKNSTARKLLPAFAMLTVSAISLSSATYAWFTMNKTVELSTMSISATAADPNIQISSDGVNFYNTLHTAAEGSDPANWSFPDTAQALTLVTPTAISTTSGSIGDVSWGWAQSTSPSAAQGDNAVSAVTLTNALPATNTTTPADRNAYLQGGVGSTLSGKYFVLGQRLTVKNLSPTLAASNLTISEVKIDLDSTNTIKNAVRILFVSEDDGTYAVYQPAASGSGFTVAATGDATKLTGATAMTATTAASSQGAGKPIIASTLAANGGTTTVDVYMYFDGTDADAYTNNASNLSDVSATFKFAID
jgi:hypothetical protein